MAFFLAACGTTIPPIPTSAPTQSRPPATPIPSRGAFVPAAYPADGDAPCGQAKVPDAAHAVYRGNLKRIKATNSTTVVFELCDPDAAFLAKIASPAFAINDAGWLRSHLDKTDTGEQAIVTDVNGTGPYRLERWDHGAEISLARNDVYWGGKAQNERLIVRWAGGSAARVTELQNGTVDGIDGVDPAGVATISDDVSIQLQPRPGLNVAYMGFNDTDPPFDNEQVRRAIAIGIDRQQIVDTDFPPGADIATHFTPCAIPHGCAGDPWYEYDPTLAKEMLAAAGHPNGFDTTIRYSETPRPYLPDPTTVARALQTQLLDNLGIRAELAPEPDATFLSDIDAGKLDGIHLFGQTATYPDVTAFLDPRFGPGASAEFGKPFTDIGKALATGRSTAVDAKRDAAYAKANDAIRSHVPMIPIARTGTATAYRADVDAAAASPLGLERFAAMTPGDRRQLVWLTTSEPPGLYCADETDVVASLVCSQLMEGLYAYDPNGAAAVPALATGCDPNPELTTWTCTLRRGVLFHDGSGLDANDVVLSFAVQWDAEHPLHLGPEGTFATFASRFGGFLDPPANRGP
jgi:ABC-type dipeptide transport system, periplasmic component